MVDQNGYGPAADLFTNGDICEQPPTKLSLLTSSPDDVVEGDYFSPVLDSYSVQPTESEHDQQISSYPVTCAPNADSPPNDRLSFGHTNRITSNHHVPTEKMSRTNLYIKGLPDNFTDEKLWHLAPQISQIKSVKAATDDDGKCRGYGFIDFISEDSANEALRHIRETYPAFTIKFAKENEKDKTNLYVTNLPKSWTTKDSDQLKMVFERFGTIQSAFVMMERSTNRTTGVGFVRYANERDALNALESIKNDPIILPECTYPIEAKFADKHNPESRRRRYPLSGMLNASEFNGFMGYPFNICNGSNGTGTEALNALLNLGLPIPSAVNAHSHLLSVHGMQTQKHDYSSKLAQGLYSGPISAKISPHSTGTVPVSLTDFGLTCGNTATTESQLNALAAVAASALLTSPAGHSAFVNNAIRHAHPCAHNTISPNMNGNIIPANTLSLFGANAFPQADAAVLDPNGLYRCSLYGNEFYRQTQQQQQQQHQLLAAAMSSLTNNHSANPVYATFPPDLAPYLNYANLLNHHQTGTLNANGIAANCVVPNGSTLTPVLTNPLNGLLNAVSVAQATNSPICSESVALLNSRSPAAALQQWILPNHMIKNVSNEITGLVCNSTISQNQEM